ncbi:MBL fold metallo-hydrolase [Streptomyces laurentii]|uniref:MBL fold metallo-hydrolase n=1 Tax=Streptomyces laurentii TaxID=39478 RepID=UPI003689AC10
MRLTKYGHACVRLETGDRSLVIDPGIYSEPESLYGVAAVLVTHEHDDHLDAGKLAAARAANPDITVHAPADVASELGDWVTPVEAGDTVSAAGFTVRVVGGRHADIVDGLPGCPNVGFVVEGIYHPGDSLFLPDESIETLLVPVAGPWLHLGRAVEFTRTVKPGRAIAIHDATMNDRGFENVDWWLENHGGAPYTRLAPGASVDL